MAFPLVVLSSLLDALFEDEHETTTSTVFRSCDFSPVITGKCRTR
jgi:hypothetical protein